MILGLCFFSWGTMKFSSLKSLEKIILFYDLAYALLFFFSYFKSTVLYYLGPSFCNGGCTGTWKIGGWLEFIFPGAGNFYFSSFLFLSLIDNDHLPIDGSGLGFLSSWYYYPVLQVLDNLCWCFTDYFFI